MYTMVYQRLNDKYPTEIDFNNEFTMENYYNEILSGNDYHFCSFFYCNREYIPKWIE